MKIEALGDKIGLVRDFLTEEECNHLIEKAEKLDTPWKGQNLQHVSKEGVCIGLPEKAEAVMRQIIPNTEDLQMSTGTRIIKFTTGGYIAMHHDNYLTEQAIAYTNEHPDLPRNKKMTDQRYSCVVYLNNHEGGELYYPNQNVLYKPKAGEMIIHDSVDLSTIHGAKPLKSDLRYIFTGTLFRWVDVSDQAPIISDYEKFYNSLPNSDKNVDGKYYKK